jgi:hypothetical protein
MEGKELTPMDIIEGYKKRVSDLIDEAAAEIGYPIEMVEITSTKMGVFHKGKLVNRREVTFNIKL